MFSILSCTTEDAFSVPVETKAVARIHNTMIDMARVHVAFSRKSAVWRTPKVWLPEAKFAASPPPFEFCTKTISVRKILAITIKMAIVVYIY